MARLTRKAVPIIALVLALPFPGRGQNQAQYVEVMGNLQVYDTEDICKQARKEAVVIFSPSSGYLSFDGQTSSFDRNCGWSGRGTLRRQAATLKIKAKFKDFVQFQPTQPFDIRSTNTNNWITISNVTVVLYSKRRLAWEVRSDAHEAYRAYQFTGDNELLTRALAQYEKSFESMPDPRTLRSKADAQDYAGLYAEAAITWNRILEIEPHDKSAALAREAAFRLAESLYKAAIAANDSASATWLNVAEAANNALCLNSNQKIRQRMSAAWLDSLFNAANTSGGYSRLSSTILTDKKMRDSWSALFYGAFKEESPPNTLSRQAIILGIEQLEADLRRKGSP